MSAVIEAYAAGAPLDEVKLWVAVIEAFELDGVADLTACVVHGEVMVSATVFAMTCRACHFAIFGLWWTT